MSNRTTGDILLHFIVHDRYSGPGPFFSPLDLFMDVLLGVVLV